jgi:hypothetical protein
VWRTSSWGVQRPLARTSQAESFPSWFWFIPPSSFGERTQGRFRSRGVRPLLLRVMSPRRRSSTSTASQLDLRGFAL